MTIGANVLRVGRIKYEAKSAYLQAYGKFINKKLEFGLI